MSQSRISKELRTYTRVHSRLDRQPAAINLEEIESLSERLHMISDLIQDYITLAHENKRKESTLHTFYRLKVIFDAWLETKPRPKDLGNELVQQLSNFMISGDGKKRNSNSTVRAHFERLQTVLNFYKVKHEISLAKFRQFNRKPFHEVKDEIFTEEEVQLLWAFVPVKYYEKTFKDMLLISLYTGARLSELPTLFLSQENGGTVIGYYSSKDGEARFIPMFEPLKAVIERNLFRRSDTRPVGKSFWNTMERVGIKGEGIQIKRYGNEVERILVPRSRIVTFHSARKTFAVRMLESGVDVFTVSKLLGHNDVSTTLQYYAYISQNKQHEKVKEVFAKWQNKPTTQIYKS